MFRRLLIIRLVVSLITVMLGWYTLSVAYSSLAPAGHEHIIVRRDYDVRAQGSPTYGYLYYQETWTEADYDTQSRRVVSHRGNHILIGVYSNDIVHHTHPHGGRCYWDPELREWYWYRMDHDIVNWYAFFWVVQENVETTSMLEWREPYIRCP